MSIDELAVALQKAIENDPSLLDAIRHHMVKSELDVDLDPRDFPESPEGVPGTVSPEISRSDLRVLRDKDPLNSHYGASMMKAWPEWYMENHPVEYDKYWYSFGLPPRPDRDPNPWK
jgi:hypothetical protein|tara:strand:+ start:212 stop:562 length:351 start_codon:yes stop_codon:yes gene_type:complete